MEMPFIFGKLALEQNFTDREKEIEHLKQNFTGGINTILISPRRWGKSSLVQKAGKEAAKSDKNLRMVYIDLYNIRREEDFYKYLSEKVLSAVSNKLEELAENAKKFLKQWIPKISFTPDAQQEVSFGLDWQQVKKLISNRTRMIIINSPHNPTGAVLGSAGMEELQKITRNSPRATWLSPYPSLTVANNLR